MMNGEYMMGWGGMIFGPMMMLLCLGLFIALIVMLIKWVGGGSSRPEKALDRKLSLLREQFAKGKINVTEFEDRKRQLQV